MTGRSFIGPVPESIRRLPKDKRGYPVPRFVAWLDGEPDFRMIAPGWLPQCVEKNLCWICGCKLGARKWFVIGPMCAINRVTSEPPSHRQCSEFAARNCPFLAHPLAKRNERNMPEHKFIPGVHLDRNPGVSCVWETRTYTPFRPAGGGLLFQVGDADTATFYREGRLATKMEVLDSVEGGLPFLVHAAQLDGPEAVRAMLQDVGTFRRLLDKWIPTKEAA